VVERVRRGFITLAVRGEGERWVGGVGWGGEWGWWRMGWSCVGGWLGG